MTIEAAATAPITHAVGLHARPAIAFTKLAKTFEAKIRIRGADDQPWVDAKSIVRVMALKLRTGTTLQMHADGTDAQAAIAALKRLVERDFDEADAASETGAVSEVGTANPAGEDQG